MEKVNMVSRDVTADNIEKIGALFPNCITEVKNGDKVEKAIDFDKLRQELSGNLIEGKNERYEFTWPDKRQAIVTANAPIAKTLRPVREKSVDFDNTQNVYIEGDNLDALKLLQETYLGKIKMIYIDPPYNTGNDFVYEDDFSQNADDYLQLTGDADAQGNKLTANSDSNGRFHTDWLNMMYPRLKLAKDLLTEDGVIFISIDENEIENLKKICNEIYGESNFLGDIIWDKRNPKGAVCGVAYQHETITVYARNQKVLSLPGLTKRKEHATEMIAKVNSLILNHGMENLSIVREEYKEYLKRNKGVFSEGELAYSLIDNNGKIYRPVSMAAPDKPETRSHRPLIHPVTGNPCPIPSKGWRYIDSTMDILLKKDKIAFGKDETTVPNQKYYLEENVEEAFSSLIYYGGTGDTLGLPFDNSKPVFIISKLIYSICKSSDDIILDFFSGSATTAHSVLQLNQEDGLFRRFIMVQLPEVCDEKSEAKKAGYNTICDIGEERIRRAGKKIKEEAGLMADNLDTGFRVFKIDDSNMKDVYYRPDEFQQDLLLSVEDNIKEDRTPEDLLFQVMIDDFGIPLSAKIEKLNVNGKTVFNVEDGHLVACFDKGVTDEVITAMAKLEPNYAVLRDSSYDSDSVAVNFEQIFKKFSPDTVTKIL